MDFVTSQDLNNNIVNFGELSYFIIPISISSTLLCLTSANVVQSYIEISVVRSSHLIWLMSSILFEYQADNVRV